MKLRTELIMGMPITVAVTDEIEAAIFSETFNIFKRVDERFSTYKETSEMSAINRGELSPDTYSKQMRDVLKKCDEFKKSTNGYFDIFKRDKIDPSGLVKGWSIGLVVDYLKKENIRNFFIDAGGDVYAGGQNEQGNAWSVGIRHPLQKDKQAKYVQLNYSAIATSGNYERGLHLYNPFTNAPADYWLSVSVIGPDIVVADVLATTAFVMGEAGPAYISTVSGYEAFFIDKTLVGHSTDGFDQYVKPS
jgi:thiamine biosynthesis lipoprotein